MKHFRALVRGEHFRIDLSGERRHLGFFVTRFVAAADADLVRAVALQAVRTDEKPVPLVLNDDDDPPRLFVDELEEVSAVDVPDVEPGFAFFDDRAQSASRGIGQPPYLVIREGLAFWVDDTPLSDWTATAQALAEGCFRDARIYDTNGDLWRIVDAGFRQRPSLLDAFLPWRQFPILIETSASPRPAIGDVLAELVAILESRSDFSETLEGDPAEILDRLRRAMTPAELIDCARKCV